MVASISIPFFHCGRLNLLHLKALAGQLGSTFATVQYLVIINVAHILCIFIRVVRTGIRTLMEVVGAFTGWIIVVGLGVSVGLKQEPDVMIAGLVLIEIL